MKSCSICNNKLPLEEFNRKSSSKDGLQPHCRTCNRERSRAYYERNRESHKTETIRRKKIHQAANRQRIWDYLRNNPCVHCNESDPIVLEFDHLDPKTKFKEISRMLDYSWDRIFDEINKCQVLCANCHRRKTAKEQNWYLLQVGAQGIEPCSSD